MKPLDLTIYRPYKQQGKNTMKHIKTLCLIITALFSQPLLAQQGPVIGCAECNATNNKAVPVSGNWYNPEQSGTGYILDVKKGRVVGLYFGYDEQGKALWLSFLGELQASADENVVWTLEAPLVKYSGGNAFNQAHRFPNQIEATGDVIKLDFHFAHYASVQINNGSVQHLIPLNYGVETEKEFKETDHLFPKLEGIWTFIYRNKHDVPPIPRDGFEFYIREKMHDEILTYRFANSTTGSSYFAALMCGVDGITKELGCSIRGLPYLNDVGGIEVAPANIGPNYIYAENEDYKFEAFRVNYFELEED